MRKLVYALVILTLGCAPEEKSGTKGTIVFDTVGTRPLQIYLPPGHSPTATYPVAYFHDGQNLFIDSTSYAGEWRIDEILDSLITADRIEPMIVVGIYNSPKRSEEYTPFKDTVVMEMLGMDTWNEELHLIYADFVIEDVLPFIEEKYGASNSRADRAIFGSSLGGLNVLWIGLSYSNAFSYVGALSPSVWVGNGAILRNIEFMDSISGNRVWIDHGELEWDERNITLIADLEQRGMSYGENLWLFEHKGAKHNEKAWSARVVSPLLLFKGKSYKEGFQLQATILKAPDSFDDNAPLTCRVNALVSYESGVFYSLINKAVYRSDAFHIEADGTIPNPPDHDALIEVAYRGMKVSVKWE